MDNVSAKSDPVNGGIRCVRNPIVPNRGCAPKVLHKGSMNAAFATNSVRAAGGRRSFARR